MAEPTVPRLPGTSPTGPAPCGTVSEWLASAHPSPSMVRNEWSSAAQLALIPVGRIFDAVRLPGEIVHAAAQSDESSAIGTRLAEYICGPVIHDPGWGRYYALVPPGTAPKWRAQGTECLSEGTYLGVPRTDHTELDERTQASYWSVPMSQPGRLCSPADVLALVTVGNCFADKDDA